MYKKLYKIEVKIAGEVVFSTEIQDKDFEVTATQVIDSDWKSDIDVIISNSNSCDSGIEINGFGGYYGSLSSVIDKNLDEDDDGRKSFTGDLVMS